MKRSGKTMLMAVFMFLVLVVGGSIGGIYYVVKLLQDNYVDPNYNTILDLTSDEEGHCLTDLVQEYNLSLTNTADVFKDACVSIVAGIEGSSDGWLGSGVCVASKGYEFATDVFLESGSYIVTNHHVFDEAYLDPKFELFVYPNDYTNVERYGSEIKYEAEILWTDSYLDMAIIHVKENIDWILMKDRSIECAPEDAVKTNETVFAIGSPQELANQNTITSGHLAFESESYAYTVKNGSVLTSVLDNVYEYLMPMNVPIQGGNSGGGLFDGQGYLIGQPTLGGENSGESSAVNYAIPIYPATLILNELILSNEDEEKEEEVKIYNLDDLNFRTIDKYEWEIVGSNFQGMKRYFYGTDYTVADLTHSESGLKIIKTNSVDIKKGDYIISLEHNEEKYNLDCRNDLIFVLLKLRRGDKVTLNFLASESVELEII